MTRASVTRPRWMRSLAARSAATRSSNGPTTTRYTELVSSETVTTREGRLLLSVSRVSSATARASFRYVPTATSYADAVVCGLGAAALVAAVALEVPRVAPDACFPADFVEVPAGF